MAVDLGEILAFQNSHGPRCRIERIIETLPAVDVEKLNAAMSSPAIQTKAIQLWLRSKQVDVGTDSVSRHRKGDCRCART